MIVKHVLIWMIVFIMMAIFLPMIVDGETYKRKIIADQENLSRDVGEQSAQFIILKADKTYKALFEESGLQDWALSRYSRQQSPQASLLPASGFEKAGDSARQYLITFFISMYEAVFRFTQLFFWSLYALPFVFAAAFDGLMQRKIRIETFQYSSPVRFNTMWHFLIMLTAVTFIYCNLPVSMPALIFPAIVILASMALRTMLSDLQRSA